MDGEIEYVINVLLSDVPIQEYKKLVQTVSVILQAEKQRVSKILDAWIQREGILWNGIVCTKDERCKTSTPPVQQQQLDAVMNQLGEFKDFDPPLKTITDATEVRETVTRMLPLIEMILADKERDRKTCIKVISVITRSDEPARARHGLVRVAIA